MDLFDLGLNHKLKAEKSRQQSQRIYSGEDISEKELEFKPTEVCEFDKPIKTKTTRRLTPEESRKELQAGLSNFSHKDILVIGVESDILFPAWQQREISELLKAGAKEKGGDGSNIKHIELSQKDSFYGHDTFLLAVDKIGAPISQFLNN